MNPQPARKRFGQHFLVRADLAQRIVDIAGLGDAGEGTVLEIGPGRGAMTEMLRAKAKTLVVVEIDRDLVRELRARYASQENVHIIEADVLRLDLEAELGDQAPVTVVANLPYNISTPLLGRFFDAPHLYRRLVLMVQREVAERICATPGGKDYGALSVHAQTAARARVAFRVPPSAFRPQPKVESAVIVLEPHRPPTLSAGDRSALRRVTRALFSQRRKQLGNSLQALSGEARNILAALGIDPKRRPETLSPDDFIRLSQALDG